MELVRVLPSVEDEVNVACFHPSVGGGLVYGTKEGKLRILQYDSSNGMTHNTPDFLARGPHIYFRMLVLLVKPVRFTRSSSLMVSFLHSIDISRQDQ
ncbi:hypothetical protein V6N13_041122 [Hibiscus sabdariffa]|uniref:Uncharacterized protein n=1 Tax=Hibiscus sabdariffa TaxID=183260 RepID=A0ABR2RAI5_9ROSI